VSTSVWIRVWKNACRFSPTALLIFTQMKFSTVSTCSQNPKYVISPCKTKAKHFVEACFKCERASRDYTTSCTRSCKRHRSKRNAKKHTFLCKYNGRYIASPNTIEVMYICIVWYIDNCARPRLNHLWCYCAQHSQDEGWRSRRTWGK